jgi:hypothetical protein
MTTATLAQVQAAFHESVEMLGKALVAFPWTDKNAYATWLGQTYYLVRHTTRLICVSAGKCALEDQELHDKSVWHLKEEWKHDDIALADLRFLGYDIAQIPELPQATAIYHSQYYYLDRFGPYAVLGYSYMLEGLAALKGAEVTAILTKAFGPKSCRFLKVHAEEDEGHVQAGLTFLEKLDEKTLGYIHRNMMHSRVAYPLMLQAAAAAGGGAGSIKRVA